MNMNSRINILNISGLMVLGILTILATFYYSKENIREEISTIRTILIEERKAQLTELIDNAYSVLCTANYYQDARKAIGNMRFGTGKKNYFFIVDMDGMMLVHPEHPELEEKIQTGLQDADGRKIILEILEAAQKKEEGFFQYRWAKPGTDIPVTKMAYFKVFKNWKWVLCTGIYLDDVEQVIDQKKSDLANTMTVHIQLLAGFILIILVCVMALGFRITRKISGPIYRIIQGLDEGAGQVASAAGQVSSAGQSLAEGSSEQAASIEETSSLLEEMASMTRQNADNAGQADSLMKQANQVVNKANTSMGQLTTSMLEISKASEETSKIIKTIDEIAFQTNLLALNAAVEAARAGEAGAGFAVVADEVRNLAMRAADAAKNTASLIEGTVKKISDGTALVKTTNEAFNEVAGSTQKVGVLVGEIAAASHEQSHGIEQVNLAVMEMDKTTQHNAATAEESASASEELNAQAEELKGFVSDLSEMVGGRASLTNDTRIVNRPRATDAGLSPRKALAVSKKPVKGRALAHSRSKQVHPDEIIPMDEKDFKDFEPLMPKFFKPRRICDEIS
ncbi:MAG: cache domain-containing protein [Deltaproteobacteria bacterium]|nr:cache domain-containing protein [Deltaproteobacteria bacterium]